MNEQAMNSVVWFEIYVDDMDRAKAFYSTVLGVELAHIPNPELDMWTFPMAPNGGGSGGALVHHKDVKAGGNSTMVYFTCQHCAVEESRVADAGGQVVRPKTGIGEYGFTSIFKDSEGNQLGLHSFA